jgi:hypothetical protein
MIERFRITVPAVARTRGLDDLGERLQRHRPELRPGRPVRQAAR